MKFEWKLDRWAIECVTVRDGEVDANSLEEAQEKICRMCRWLGHEISDWSDWEETTIDLHPYWNALCKPPLHQAWEKEGQLAGKGGTLTMWEVEDE